MVQYYYGPSPPEPTLNYIPYITIGIVLLLLSLIIVIIINKSKLLSIIKKSKTLSNIIMLMFSPFKFKDNTSHKCYFCGKDVISSKYCLCEDCYKMRIYRITEYQDEIIKSQKEYEQQTSINQKKYSCCEICGIIYKEPLSAHKAHNDPSMCPDCLKIKEEISLNGNFLKSISASKRARAYFYKHKSLDTLYTYDEDDEPDEISNKDKSSGPKFDREQRKILREEKKEQKRLQLAEKKFLKDEEKNAKKHNNSGYKGC